MSDQTEPAPVVVLPTPPTPAKKRVKTEWEYATDLAGKLPATKTVGKRWFSYDDKGVWQELDPAIYRPIAHSVFSMQKCTDRRAMTLLNHLESRWQHREDIFRGAMCFDEERAVLINVLNGVLRVRPGKIELLAHSKDHYFTRCLQVAYDPDAKCVIYRQTLGQALPDPLDQHLLLLCFGNFLLPDCRFEAALVCYGEAGSGKGTLARPVIDIFGSAAHGLMTHLTMGQLCDPNCYALAKLRYACVNLGTELQSIAVEESANYKTIVSGEPLEARPIYCPPFTMNTACKLWFLANNLPRFKHGTEAELRRTRFLRFEYKPETPDVMLKEKVAEERAGVFNFMLEGLQELLTAKAIPLGGAHSQATHTRFQVSNDPIGTFVKRHCTFSPDASVQKTILQGSFDAYCEQHSVPKQVKEYFLKMLYERYPDVDDSRVRVDNQRVWVVKGLQLNETAPDSAEYAHITDNA